MNYEDFEGYNKVLLPNDEKFEGKNICSVNLNKKGLCNIYVYSYEGLTIPHFHIIGDNFECCICMYEPFYWSHNGKYTDTLTNKELNILHDKLYEDSDFWKGMTNLDVCMMFWDTGNVGVNGFATCPFQNDYKVDFRKANKLKFKDI